MGHAVKREGNTSKHFSFCTTEYDTGLLFVRRGCDLPSKPGPCRPPSVFSSDANMRSKLLFRLGVRVLLWLHAA